MRCLSPHGNYGIQVFEGEEQVVVDARGHAKSLVLKKPVIADFDRGGLLDHEIDIALQSFSFSGLAEGVNPLSTISVFDSEAYVQRFPEHQRDEMVVQIDQRMRELQKLFPSQFCVADPEEAARPWPSYDEDSVEDILNFQERLRIKPETIRLYEVQNRNRQAVVEPLLRIEDPEDADRQFGAAEEAKIVVTA